MAPSVPGALRERKGDGANHHAGHAGQQPQAHNFRLTRELVKLALQHAVHECVPLVAGERENCGAGALGVPHMHVASRAATLRGSSGHMAPRLAVDHHPDRTEADAVPLA